MAEPTRFIFNLHCHQPVGNFESVLEEATDQCYRPLLEALARHPAVPFVWHASGPLWEWWDRSAPDVVGLVTEAVVDQRCEIQCGGLYEPILPAVPRADRTDQIDLHRADMVRRFGGLPGSLWLTERVWEPGLASDLARVGVQSVPVDDHHFQGAGLPSGDLDGVWITEDEGERLWLFPISTRLRYLIPFEPVDQVMAWMKERHDRGQQLLVFGDDGEKFGVWPDTRQWVFEEGWLESFLSALEGAADWLRPTTYARTLEELVPVGRVYLPATSYEEMDEWCLPAAAIQRLEDARADLGERFEQVKPFVRGTLWRNMLAKYPEANRLYQRMLWVSRLTREHGLREELPAGLDELHAAVRSLFRAQCNCAYWHGVFGGLYLPFLRDAVVGELMAARSCLEDVHGECHEFVDLDGDGQAEVLLEKGGWSLWIAPSRGGALEVWDDRLQGHSLLNVVGRHAEAYHRTPAEDPAHDPDAPRTIHDTGRMQVEVAPELLVPDRFPRAGFALHVLGEGADVGPAIWLGEGDVGTGPEAFYEAEFDRDGVCRMSTLLQAPVPLQVERAFRVATDGGLVVDVALTPEQELRGTLVLRTDLSVPRCGSDDRGFLDPEGRWWPTDQTGEFHGSFVTLREDTVSYRWSSSVPFRGILQPLCTASRSEAGLEPSQQGVTLALCVGLEIAAGQRWPLRLRIEREGAAR